MSHGSIIRLTRGFLPSIGCFIFATNKHRTTTTTKRTKNLRIVFFCTWEDAFFFCGCAIFRFDIIFFDNKSELCFSLFYKQIQLVFFSFSPHSMQNGQGVLPCSATFPIFHVDFLSSSQLREEKKNGMSCALDRLKRKPNE